MTRHFFLKYIYFLLGAFVLTSNVRAQEPDLSKVAGEKEKIAAWLNYCESLRLNNSGVKNNYLLLQLAGLKGLSLVREGDQEDSAKFLFDTGIGYYYQLKFDSALYYFFGSLHTAQRGHVTKLITKACVALIPVTFQMQQTDKTEDCKNILQSIADTTHNQSLLKDLYYALGSYYQEKFYYSTAQDYFIKSIELREKEVDTTKDLKTKFDYAIQCDMLSKLYLNTEMADKSISALRQGDRFAYVSPNVSNRLLSSYVEAYTMLGNIDSALFYNNRLDSLTRSNPMFPSEIVSSDLNIALYYLDHHQYDKALPYIVKGDTLAAHIQSPLLIFQAQMAKGRYLEETGKFDQAIPLLTQALPVAIQLDKGLYANILKYMALAQKGRGNTIAALQYYESYVQTEDTLNKEKLSRTFADLETHYQTSQKEQRIASLNKENQLRALELKTAAQERLFLIIGMIALGIIALLLYFIYRNKERLSRQLQIANETKARLFGIISHDLRAPVSRIVQLLRLQKERPDLLGEEARGQHDERLKIASENVLETMEDLLLWSKSQMESFTPQFSSVRMLPLVQKEIDLYEEQATAQGVTLMLDIPVGFSIQTDENFVSVIIRNLLQNAIKYSDPGGNIIVRALERQIQIINPSQKGDAGQLNEKLKQSRVNSDNSGLGLQISASLATSIHATLHFERQEDHTLAAVLSWPQ